MGTTRADVTRMIKQLVDPAEITYCPSCGGEIAVGGYGQDGEPSYMRNHAARCLEAASNWHDAAPEPLAFSTDDEEHEGDSCCQLLVAGEWLSARWPGSATERVASLAEWLNAAPDGELILLETREGNPMALCASQIIAIE